MTPPPASPSALSEPGEVRSRQLSAAALKPAGQAEPACSGSQQRVDMDILQPSPVLSASQPAAADAGSPALLLLVFVLAVLAVAAVVASLPPLPGDEWERLRLPPRSMADVSLLTGALSRYRLQHPHAVLLLFCLLYVFLQSFAIPGPVLLSLMAGPLFGFTQALLLVSVSATVGASCCYWLSFLLARSLLERWAPQLLSSLRQRIDRSRQSGDLLYQLVFLRISPLLPNWFINTATPHLHVPFPQFVLATAVGLLPANYIHVSTGMQVDGLREASDAGWQQTALRVAALFLLASLALLPTLCKVGSLRQRTRQQPHSRPLAAAAHAAAARLLPPLTALDRLCVCRRREWRRTRWTTRGNDAVRRGGARSRDSQRPSSSHSGRR